MALSRISLRQQDARFLPAMSSRQPGARFAPAGADVTQVTVRVWSGADERRT